MLQERSETEDKAQSGAPYCSTDTRVKIVEFSDSPKRHDESDKNSSDSDGDEQNATQEQPRQLSQSVRVSVSPTRYD